MSSETQGQGQEAQQQQSTEQPQGQEQQAPQQATEQVTEAKPAEEKAAEQKPAVQVIEKKEVKLPRPRVTLTGKLRRLMRLRLEMERRMPRWMRMDEWRYLRVAHGEHWRRPRGNDNKIRLEIKGYPRRVKIGYGKPKAVRGLHPSGFKLVIVHRPEDVDKVDPTKEAIVIGRTVGLRKRIEIVKKAIERGVKIINPTKDVIEKLSE